MSDEYEYEYKVGQQNSKEAQDFATAIINNDLSKLEKICEKLPNSLNINGDLHFTFYVPFDHEYIDTYETALQVALDHKFNGAAKLLIEKCGTDINAPNRVGNTPILSALSVRNEEGVDLLIAHGVNLNPQLSLLEKPLESLANSFSPDDKKNTIKILSLAKKLIDHGAETSVIIDPVFFNAFDSYWAPIYKLNLLQAILSNHLKEIKKICENPRKIFNIDYILNTDQKNPEVGQTALQIALKHGFNDAAKLLIEKCGADVNAEGTNRIFPLFSTINSLNPDGVDLLIAHGLNPNPKIHLYTKPLEQLRVLFHGGYNKTIIMSMFKKLKDYGADTPITDDPIFWKAYHSYLNSTSQQILTTKQSTIPDLTTLSPEEAKKQLNNMTDYFLTTGHSSNLTTTTFASSTLQSNQTTPVIYDNRNNITIPENNVTVVTNQVNHTRFNDPAEVTDLTFLTQMMSAIQDNPWTIAAVGTLVAAGIAGLSWFGLKNRNEERQDNRLIVTYSKMSFEESLMLIK